MATNGRGSSKTADASGLNARMDGAAPAEGSTDMVARVGAAMGKVALIQQAYTAQVEANGAANQDALEDQAQRAAVKAIDEEGITVDEYNAVLTAAADDPDLEERLLAAAREAI